MTLVIYETYLLIEFRSFFGFLAGGIADKMALSNSWRAAIAHFEFEEGEQGIGYFTTLYLHLFTPLCL